MLLPVRHDIVGKLRPDSRDRRQQLGAGHVDFHSNPVHATDHHILQPLLEDTLIHVMLILSDSNRLGVDLHQLRKGVHEPSPDGHRATYRHVLFGKFFTGHLRGGIDRGPTFIHHDQWNGRRQFERAKKSFGFPAGRAIANGNRLNLKSCHQPHHRLAGFSRRTGSLMRVDGLRMTQIALPVQADNFAAGTKTGIDRQNRPLP